MVRAASPWRFTLSDALASLRSDELRPMMSRLSVPKPRPTRKADMIAAIESRLAGGSLRGLWDNLDEIQQLAVSEALHDPHGGFHSTRFKAKYGALPAGLGPYGAPESLPLRFFLHPDPGDRFADSTLIIPVDMAERLYPFVPPPPEVALAAEDELPEAVDRRRRGYVPKGEKPEFDRVEAASTTSRDSTAARAGVR